MLLLETICLQYGKILPVIGSPFIGYIVESDRDFELFATEDRYLLPQVSENLSSLVIRIGVWSERSFTRYYVYLGTICILYLHFYNIYLTFMIVFLLWSFRIQWSIDLIWRFYAVRHYLSLYHYHINMKTRGNTYDTPPPKVKNRKVNMQTAVEPSKVVNKVED